MATSEPTTSSTEMLLPVSVKNFFKWSDLKDIHLSDLKDSPEDTARRETSHTLDFQQDSPGLFSKLSSMNVVVTPSLYHQ